MPKIPMKRRRALAKRVCYLAHQVVYACTQEYWITHLRSAESTKVDMIINRDPSRVKVLRIVDQEMMPDIYGSVEQLVLQGFDMIKDRETTQPDRSDLLELLELVVAPHREWLHYRFEALQRLKFPSMGDDMKRYIKHTLACVIRTAFTLAVFELKAWYDDEDKKPPVRLEEPDYS